MKFDWTHTLVFLFAFLGGYLVCCCWGTCKKEPLVKFRKEVTTSTDGYKENIISYEYYDEGADGTSGGGGTIDCDKECPCPTESLLSLADGVFKESQLNAEKEISYYEEWASDDDVKDYRVQYSLFSAMANQLQYYPETSQGGFRLKFALSEPYATGSDLMSFPGTIKFYVFPAKSTGESMDPSSDVVYGTNASDGYELPCPRYCDFTP
jgi:hypothetical protein